MSDTPTIITGEVIKAPEALVKKNKKKGVSMATLEQKPLTLAQETFCRMYTSEETWSNGVWSYAAAYGYKLDTLSKEEEWERDEAGNKIKLIKDSDFNKAHGICGSNASILLRIPRIQERIRQLLYGSMNDEEMDAELAYVAKQRHDITGKVAAIKEYNRLKGRVIEKRETNHKHSVIALIKGIHSEVNNKRKNGWK